MELITLESLTQADLAEVQRVLEDSRGWGWKPAASTRYKPGKRIRHHGQQYPEAFRNGTGIIVTELRRGQEIELVVAYDEPRFPGMSRITRLGNYHVDLGPFGD